MGGIERERSFLIGGKQYRVSNGIIRMMSLCNEFIDECAEPEGVAREIRERKLPVDVLTFLDVNAEGVRKWQFPYYWDNLAVLHITTYVKWLREQVAKSARNTMRKAERLGVVVRVEPFSDKVVDCLVDIFNETQIRQGRKNLYFGWDREMVKKGWATELERSEWLLAYYEDECIGFIKLVVGDGLARASGTVAKIAHRDKGPMNALLAKAVEVCAERGIGRLLYGKYVYGNKGEDTLTAFKKSNGFRKVEIPRYYLPISLRGYLGINFGLHMKMVDALPTWTLRFLRKSRERWNTMKTIDGRLEYRRQKSGKA